MALAPVALFVYNRIDHLQKTVESLKRNKLAKETKLYIFSDGIKGDSDQGGVSAVRRYIKKISGFSEIEIVEKEKNHGLASSIISGVSEILQKHGKVIVMEDDLVSSSFFLTFMNEMLDQYQLESKVFAISGFTYPKNTLKIPANYNYDIFFFNRMHSWGWATWADRWEKADWEVKDFDYLLKDKECQKMFNRGGEDLFKMLSRWKGGELDVWAVRWCYTAFKNNGLSIYPTVSFIQNIGFDNSGVNCGYDSGGRYSSGYLNNKTEFIIPKGIEVDSAIADRFQAIFRKNTILAIIKKYYKKINKLNIKNKNYPEKIKRFILNKAEEWGYEIRIGRVGSGSSIFSVLKHLFSQYKIDLVIDVGAYVGEYAKISRRAGYSGNIVSFEPLEDNFKRINIYSKGDQLWSVLKTAVGNEDGSIDINVASDLVSSSVLGLNNDCDYFKSKVDYVSSERVEIRKLDTLTSQGQIPSFKNALLKIDVQGLEGCVIDGAMNILSEVRIIQIEMSLVSVYDGQILMVDLLKRMGDLGYELFTILPVFKNEHTGQLFQVDGFFIRK
jgi:FkbM family methyltransferase